MSKWNVDRRKMYAHVYFDLSQDSLGVAVYALGKVPGFAKKLSPEVAEATGKARARDAFLKILGKEDISPEELQSGKAFRLQDVEPKLKQLDLLGKLIAEDSKAQVVVDLDDPMLWFEAKLREQSTSRQQMAKSLSREQKIEIGTKVRDQEMSQELQDATTPEELQDALQRLYIHISRSLHPSTGPKDFPGTKKYPSPNPPAFLTSEELDLAYYPGFRGAQWMRKLPGETSKEVFPMGREDQVPSDQKWQTILIPDCKQYSQTSLQMIDIRMLDYVSEKLARMFFSQLPQQGEMNIMLFNQATEPMKDKAKKMLSKIGEQYKEVTTAGTEVGTWISLDSGKIYDTEESLLADIDMLEVDEQLPLAASVNLRKVARILLKRDRLDLYERIAKRYE